MNIDETKIESAITDQTKAIIVVHYAGVACEMDTIMDIAEETDKKEKVTLVGNLCTATDVIAEDIVLPSMDCGDIILINNAGSYAAVLSPMQFSSQEKPVEVFLSVDGSIKIN